METKTGGRKLLISLGLVILVVLLDQLTKFIAYNTLRYGSSKAFIDRVWQWTLTINKNTVWGISLGKNFPYPVMVIVLSIVVIALIVFERQPKFYIPYAMILGGAIGNLIDRLRIGGVVDFIDIGIPNGPRWPIFNVADSFISVGIVALLLFSILEILKENPALSKEVSRDDN